VLRTGWTEVVALAAAHVIGVVGDARGDISVLLLPFQVSSVQGRPRSAVTLTNLRYNVVATLGGTVDRHQEAVHSIPVWRT
jgi:hypothetical protein